MSYMNRVVDKIIRLLVSNNSKLYVKYLREMGCSIGDGTKFHGRKNVDITRPELINIGNDVTITDGVWLLTHGHDWSVLRNKYKDPMIIGSAGEIRIGNNVFIGTNSVILKGARIGNNCIIGANSLVAHSIPDNSVAFGIPAKVVLSVDEYYQKRKSIIKNECLEYTKILIKAGMEIDESKYWEFFPLFKDRREALNDVQKNQLKGSIQSYYDSQPVWNGLGELIEEAKTRSNESINREK